jgi:sigma-B regulation protein RsbU (phosphoserine phosphatase)
MILVWFFLGITVGAAGMMPILIKRRLSMKRLSEQILRLEQEKTIVLEFMHTMVEEVGAGADIGALRQRIVRAAMTSTGATSACLFEAGADKVLRGIAIEGLFPPQHPVPQSSAIKLSTRVKFVEQILRSEEIAFGEGVVGSVAQDLKPLFIGNGAEDPRVCRHSDPSLAIRSMMLAPLLFRDNFLGVIAVANPAAGESFSESEFSILQSLAEQSAMALHNADLIQLQLERSRINVDLSLASDVQRLLLPKVYPRREGLEIATHYVSAQKVGGDLFDLIDLPDDRLGFAIADVSGKGISAGLLMALCQTHLRHLARDFSDPAEVLQAMNRELLPEISNEMFVTMIYGILDLKEGTVTLARAGHELPLLVHNPGDTGVVEKQHLRSPGMALGMVDQEIFSGLISSLTVPFLAGDILVLYTDGVTESVNADGEEFSKERLAQLVARYQTMEAEGIKNKILEEVSAFAGARGVADDLTLVVLRLRP